MWLICFRQFSPMGKSCWCLEESTYPLGEAFWAQSREMGFIDQRLKPIVPSLSSSQDCLFKTFCTREGSHRTFPTTLPITECPWADLCGRKAAAPQGAPGSAHTARGHLSPSLPGEPGDLLKKGPRWPVTAREHQHSDAAGCPQPAGWSWHCCLAVWSAFNLILSVGAQSWQELGDVITG